MLTSTSKTDTSYGNFVVHKTEFKTQKGKSQGSRFENVNIDIIQTVILAKCHIKTYFSRVKYGGTIKIRSQTQQKE